MKTLILAACVGSTVAVVAPQFPPPAVSFADAGMGTEVRPFSMYGEAVASSQDPIRTWLILSNAQLGAAPSEFVVTDVFAVFENAPLWSVVLKVNGSPIAANGIATYVPSTGSAGLGIHLQHGIPVPAGSLVEVEARSQYSGAAANSPMRATVAGYLR